MRARTVGPIPDNDGMDGCTESPRRRQALRFDFADPALWAWAVVVVMLALPAAATFVFA